MRVEVVIVRWNLDIVVLDIDIAYDNQLPGPQDSYVFRCKALK